MQNTAKRITRLLLCRLLPNYTKKYWYLLRYYPHVIPTAELLHNWQQSEWPEYQEWIDKHSVCSLTQWQTHHAQAIKWKHFPKISIVTPVYNTDAAILRLCILSVRIQTSPFWELILVDDGSSSKETKEVLNSRLCKDPRIHILQPEKTMATGISIATNRGIKHATGDFIAFLDHDDRLAPEAIQAISEALRETPDLDIIYSDRDMISEKGKRLMYLMKPDWSPENLYSGNYVFHLMCYRKKMLEKVGNLRKKYDGSQDYDLILRCSECHPKVKHLPTVLYHWRQNEQSIAMNDGAKSYTFEAGILALKDALVRRKIKGTVSEDQSLQRGVYQVNLPVTKQSHYDTIIIKRTSKPDQYRETIETSDAIRKGTKPYILVQHEDHIPDKNTNPGIIASWLELKSIGMVSGCLLNAANQIIYAGITFDANGKILLPYSGYSFDEPSYMNVIKTIRNISGPNPYSTIIRRDLWEQLGGLTPEFDGHYALLDFALRSLHSNWRILYNPQMVSKSANIAQPPTQNEQEIAFFKQKWGDWLQKGDPCYSPNLSRQSNNYELSSSENS